MRPFYAILAVLVLVVAAQPVVGPAAIAAGRQFFLVTATSSIQRSGAGQAPAPGARPAYLAFALPGAAAK